MQTTEHLNLNLPEATDPYDIGNENENMEILDSAIYNHGIILGSASTAGHNKIINDLSKTSLSNGEALSARMGNALGQMFAPIESSSSASRAYAIGAQFIYNGILYKATAAISQGGNINPGGNCTPASSVTAQISDLANVSVYTPTLTTGLRDFVIEHTVYKVGSIVEILFVVNVGTSLSGEQPAGYSTTLYTLPSECRPRQDVYREITVRNGAKRAFLEIDSSTGYVTFTYRDATELRYLNIYINELFIV